MEVILLGTLTAIILVLFLFNYVQFGQQKKENRLLIEEIQSLTNAVDQNQQRMKEYFDALLPEINNSADLIRQSQTEFYQKTENQTSEHMEQINRLNSEFLETLENHFAKSLETSKDKHYSLLEDQMESNVRHFNKMVSDFSVKLDQELNANEQKISDWITYVEALSTNEEQIEALESSINKYPYSKLLVLTYMKTIGALIASDNSLVKKRALERANRVVRVFLDNCDVADYPTAMKLYNDVVEQGKQFMTSSYDKRVEQTNKQLVELDKKVMEIENSNPHAREALVAELEEMEGKLDKQLIQNVKALTGEYQSISKRIINVLAEDHEEEQIKQYNLEAISSLQDLHSKLQANPKSYRTGKVGEASRVLGKWDTSYLSSQTNTYYQFVYKEIFDILHPDEKPKLTERVLKTQKKKVS